MDNELEIVNNEGMTSEMMAQKPGFLATYGPIIGAAGAVVAAGTLAYFLIVRPYLAKRKAAKAEAAKAEEVKEEPKTEE